MRAKRAEEGKREKRVKVLQSPRRKDDPKTVIVEAVIRLIIAAEGRATEPSMVIPRTAAQPEVTHPAFEISA